MTLDRDGSFPHQGVGGPTWAKIPAMTDTSPALAGRHVIVSGAGTGIGRAIALHLAGLGADLTLMARDVARLEQTEARARALGPGAIGVAGCDVRDRAAVDAVIDAAAAARGPLHA